MTGKQAGVRRVVTGHDNTGKAIVLSDGIAPFLHQSPGRPGFWSNDLWRTSATPAPIGMSEEEPTLGPRRQLPAPSGTVIRINSIPPDSVPMDAEAVKQAFTAMGNPGASTFNPNTPHPMMHRTETVDYAIVLSGELFMVLDDSEVRLGPGDVVIQRGTNHAWSNRSGAPCMIAFILVDGAFEPELGGLLANGPGH